MLAARARVRYSRLKAAAALVMLAAWMPATAVTAQQAPPAKAKEPAANPVGAGSAWKAEVTDGANVTGQTLDPKQVEIIRKIDTYFNDLQDMQGRFTQTTSDKKQAKGKFYVKRPGRFRFDYAPPSKLVILSDGKLLSIEDHDLNTVDRYPLESTPFRILLRRDVNIARDARIIDMQEADDLLVVTLLDKGGESSGQIKLFFLKQPGFELKEWVITDAQGVDTRIEIADLDRSQQIDARRFVPSPNVGDKGLGQAN